MALNHKLQTFVDVWDGDASKAARLAGLTEQYGRLLMVSAVSPNVRPKALEVQAAIRQRESTYSGVKQGLIADRNERQRFWTKNMRDESLDMRERRENSALMGKSEADFIDKVLTVDMSLADIAARMGIEGSDVDSKALGSAEAPIGLPEAAKDEGKEND